MTEYTLEEEAENDLLEIGRYTARTWGLTQTKIYLGNLEKHFAAISAGTTIEKQAIEHRSDLFVSRCEHHYVFFARGDGQDVVILAIFHENMDLLARLRDRLDFEGRGCPTRRASSCWRLTKQVRVDVFGVCR